MVMYSLAFLTASLSFLVFSARCSLLRLSTSILSFSKRTASSPVRTGVSAIGLAIILFLRDLQIYNKFLRLMDYLDEFQKLM